MVYARAGWYLITVMTANHISGSFDFIMVYFYFSNCDITLPAVNIMIPNSTRITFTTALSGMGPTMWNTSKPYSRVTNKTLRKSKKQLLTLVMGRSLTAPLLRIVRNRKHTAVSLDKFSKKF